MKMGNGELSERDLQCFTNYLGFIASMYFLYPGLSGQP